MTEAAKDYTLAATRNADRKESRTSDSNVMGTTAAEYIHQPTTQSEIHDDHQRRRCLQVDSVIHPVGSVEVQQLDPHLLFRVHPVPCPYRLFLAQIHLYHDHDQTLCPYSLDLYRLSLVQTYSDHDYYSPSPSLASPPQPPRPFLYIAHPLRTSTKYFQSHPHRRHCR